MASNQEFTFAYLLPDNYVLEILSGPKRLLLQRLVTVWPTRGMFLEIKIDHTLTSATVDDLPFAITTQAEESSASSR